MKISEQDLKKIFENPLFSGVDRDRAISLFEDCGCDIAEYADGEILHSPNNPEKSAGLVLSGKAVVTTPDSTRSTLLRFLTSGEPYGIANLFSNEPYVSIIHAHGPCRVFRMPEESIRRLLETEPAFLYLYLAFLTDRIRYLNRKIGYLTAGSAERRLALYLVSLGEQSVRLDASISALSDLLDVGRASLYRAFDKLTEDGFILKEGRNFTLLDADGMLAAYR